MKKIEDYRAHADECRSLANRAGLPTNRDMLMNMAMTWDSLAADRQARIARQERIAALDANWPVPRPGVQAL